MEKLELEVKEFRNLQQEVSKISNSRAKFLTQLNENELVKKEIELLAEDAEVFKLVGPVLIKQEKSEALSNVSKRIEFISSEMKRVDNNIKDLEKKQEEKRKKIVELQTALQSQGASEKR